MSHAHDPETILDLWFPDDGHWTDIDRHIAFWETRMQGGMDEIICRDFGPLTEAAARGELDHWADDARHRLALLIALDQFPRSYWRGKPECYGQDIKAARLALQTIRDEIWAPYAVWEKQFLLIAISHCEGPDHLERMDLVVDLGDRLLAEAPDVLRPGYLRAKEQGATVREVIRRFGRHPHRNALLGRVSTVQEAPYLEKGEFPHERPIEPNDAAES